MYPLFHQTGLDLGVLTANFQTIAALLLLNMPSPAATFIALANVLNRSLPLSFYTTDEGAQSSAYNLVLRTLSLQSPSLHEHLTKRVPGLEPYMYLNDVFMSLFTNQLAIDEASRVWDVYVFEGDAVLIRVAVAFLLRVEMNLLGSKTREEVRSVIGGQSTVSNTVPVVTEQGAEDKFMATVREAAKTS